MITKHKKLPKNGFSQSLKFVGYKKVHTYSDGMEDFEGFFEYKGKLWTNSDVLFGRRIDAEKANKDGRGIIVSDPNKRGFFVLTRVK